MDKIKILIVGHKETPVLTDDIYLPIWVGAKLSDKRIPLPWVGDDTGENISEKNKEYCELTGLYWAWKNLKDIDYVGLCHYRRYFYPINSNLNNFLRKSVRFFMYLGAGILPQRLSRECSFTDTDNLSFKEFSKSEEKISRKLRSKLNGNDIVLPTRTYLSKFSIFQQYAIGHNASDFEIMIDTMVDEFGYDKKQIEKIIKSRSFDLCNMAIMKKDLFDEYCEWLFPLLSKVESKISYEKRTPYQKRVLAFFG